MKHHMQETDPAAPGSRRAGRRRGRWLAMAAVAAGLVPLGAGAAQAAPVAPEPTNCTTIDYDKATVAPVPSAATAGTNRLTVTGTVPATNFAVTLEPLVYIQQPDFWGIEVTRCQTGDVGATIVTPFTATYDFVGSLGKCGVEAIGATRTDRFDLAGCTKPVPNPLAGTRWNLDPASLGVPVPAGRTITAAFSDTVISGSASCNLYNATYRVTGPNSIEVDDDIITTKIACDPVTAKAEAVYLKKLANVNVFRTARGLLGLSGPAGSLLFRSGVILPR